MQILEIGGAARDRTADPLRARQMLSQLSYSPMRGEFLTILTHPLVPTTGTFRHDPFHYFSALWKRARRSYPSTSKDGPVLMSADRMDRSIESSDGARFLLSLQDFLHRKVQRLEPFTHKIADTRLVHGL